MSIIAPAQKLKVQAPFVSTLSRDVIQSSDFEMIRKHQYEFTSAFYANQKEADSIIEDWKMYFGLSGEQWDDEARKYKEARNLRAAQYNIIGPKVEIFAGMMLADEYDFRYDPVQGVRNSGVEALETAYYCDKEVCHYDDNYNLFVRDGIIHVGLLEIDVTDKFGDPRGNIFFRRALPGSWIFDPYWISDDDYDCMKAWKHLSMTLRELEATFGKLPDSSKADQERNFVKRQGMHWTTQNIQQYNTPTPVFEHSWHVIMAHYIEEVRKKRLVALNAAGKWVAFPITDDNQALEEFAKQYGVTDWASAQLVPYKDRICYCDVICPELFPYDMLDSGKPEIQIKRLPVFQFTCNRDIAGRNKGLVCDLSDPQKDINYAKSKIQELFASATGGATIYDKTKLQGETERTDFEANRNDPTKAFGIEGSPEQFAKPLNDVNINTELVRMAGQETFDATDRVSNVSTAMSAMTQSAGEPNSLFENKLKVNKIGSLTKAQRIKKVREGMATGYFWQSQITYAGSERVFTSKDGKKRAVLNEDLGDGTMRNRVEDIPLCSVTITEAPGNLTRNMRTRAEISSVITSLPKDGYREHIAILLDELFSTTGMSEERKAKLEEATALEIVKARAASIAEMTGSSATVAQNKTVEAQATLQYDQVLQMLRGGSAGGAPPDQVTENPPQSAQAQGQNEPGQPPVPQQISAAPQEPAPPVPPSRQEQAQPPPQAGGISNKPK